MSWLNKNNAVCIIPARMGSTRFPGKPLAMIAGKPMIQRVYEQAMQIEYMPKTRKKLAIKACYVATSDVDLHGKCIVLSIPVLTTPECSCGTDRVAYIADFFQLGDDEIVLNIQGDLPVIHPAIITKLLAVFDENIEMATVATTYKPDADAVRVQIKNGFAESFSRNGEGLEHIGIYAYRKRFLSKFAQMKRTENEIKHSLEQLRATDNGHKIRVVTTDHYCPSVNVPNDIKKVEKWLQT